MNRFSPPIRQMPSRSMISSLPTKARFIGSSTSAARRVMVSIGVICRLKKFGRKGRSEFAMHAHIGPEQIIDARVAEPRNIASGNNAVGIESPQRRIVHKGFQRQIDQTADAN